MSQTSLTIGTISANSIMKLIINVMYIIQLLQAITSLILSALTYVVYATNGLPSMERRDPTGGTRVNGIHSFHFTRYLYLFQNLLPHFTRPGRFALLIWASSSLQGSCR